MEALWQELIAQIAAQHIAEWVAVGGAILYLVLATRESPWCWLWGILSCIAWAYAAFFLYQLYIDGGLQLFYVGISFMGLYQWVRGGSQHKGLRISTLKWSQHLVILFGGTVVSLAVGYFFAEYTSAAATYLDAFTTVFSLITTFMVIQKKLENWIYWFIIDTAYVYLYWSRGGYLIALLFISYLAIVIVGFLRWKRQYQVSGGVSGEA